MHRRWVLALVVAFSCASLLVVGQVTTWFHQSVTTATGASGTVNWIEGWIQVTGYGVPAPQATTEAQGKLLARDAAIADAQWRLLEIIKGLSVTAAATVLDHMASSAFRSEVEASIKRFQIIEESWEVPMKTFLFFFKRKGDWREGEYKVALIYNQQGLLFTFIPEVTPEIPEGETTTETIEPTEYTGVVFDARGYGPSINPSLFVKLVDSQGNVVVKAVAISYVPSAGYRLGIPDLAVENAMQDPRVGDNPLEAQVLGTAEKGFALVISQTDAALIRQIGATSNILTRGGGSVLVVSD